MVKSRNARHGLKDPIASKEEDPTMPVFFYMPNVPPYASFCQWFKSPFTATVESLEYLKTENSKTQSSEASTPAPAPTGITGLTTATSSKAAGASKLAETITFNCAEQYMMYCKALHASDTQSMTLILRTPDPKEQKRLGRNVKNLRVCSWDQIKSHVVVEGNFAKFTQCEKLKRVLLATGERVLCEASSRDRVWGIGFNENDGRRMWTEKKEERWGENLLGKALMAVRERIREAESVDAQKQ